MKFEVIAIHDFEKNLKRLVKKFPSLKEEYFELVESLENQPIQGDKVFSNCYKVRLSIASKGKGKSGGARVITYIKIVKRTVYLLTIFDKSEKENVEDWEINALLKQIK
jgi:mRNA-degrading endonuclease RelE of RelBE toxin-antitoxin system